MGPHDGLAGERRAVIYRLGLTVRIVAPKRPTRPPTHPSKAEASAAWPRAACAVMLFEPNPAG